jgi:PEP-CTERM motif
MKNVLQKFLLVAAVTLVGFAPSSFADSMVTVDGTYAFADNGYGIPPYGGTLDGQAASFYCVDFTHDIGAGNSWLAIVTPLTSSGTSIVPYLAGKTTDGVSDYLLFAWLITQMTQTSSQSIQAQDQWAIWSLTDGNYDPYGNQASILSTAAAQLTAANFTGQGWEILTPDASLNQYGQEFIVSTPEPSTILLFGLGLAGMFLLKRREKLPTLS